MPRQTTLWIGEKKLGRFVNSSDNVMDSLYFYIKDLSLKIRYSFKSLFLDNGAYSAARKEIDLNPERVKEIQESLNPDLTIPLDYPFVAGTPRSVMEEKWSKTIENYLEWQQTTNLHGRLVPIVHAWSVRSLISNVKLLQKHADSEMLAIGSIVCFGYNRYTGYFQDRQPRRELIDMLINAVQAVRKFSDFGVHVAGFGSSPLMLHLGYFCGVNSTDTTGYRRKAAYGKISLPGTGDRHVGRKDATWGVRKLKDKDLRLLRECECPICREDQTRLWTSWEARAIHNKYVLQYEEVRARGFLERDKSEYEKFLDDMFATTGLSYLWRYTKIRANYVPVDLWYLK